MLKEEEAIRAGNSEQLLNLPNHSNTNRPRCIADRQTQLGDIGPLVLSFLHVMHNFSHTSKHVGSKRLVNDRYQ